MSLRPIVSEEHASSGSERPLARLTFYGLPCNGLWGRRWARRGLNPRPIDYESTALTN